MAVDGEAEFCEHCGAKLGEHKPAPWWHLHRRVYDWTLAWAYHPSAAWALAILSFAESSFFPVPPDVLLAPLVLGNRKKWVRYASICSIGSVMGAVMGFLIGWLLWSQVGSFFHHHVPGFGPDEVVLKDGQQKVEGFVDRGSLEMTSPVDMAPKYPLTLDGGKRSFQKDQVESVNVHAFTKTGKYYERYNFWIVFTAGFTPIPYKVITITAGVFGTGESEASPWLFFVVFLIASIVSRSARFFLVAGLMRKFGPKITPFIDRYFNWLALLFVVLLVGGFLVIKYAV